MGGTQLEHAQDLIDANLTSNRDQVLQFIVANPQAVQAALAGDGYLKIPTTAGVVTIDVKEILAAA